MNSNINLVRVTVRALIAASAILGLGSVAWAQAVPVPPPDAGSVLREYQTKPSLPAEDLNAPNLVVPNTEQGAATGGPKVDIRRYQLNGVSAANAESLLPLLTSFVGAGKTLADIEAAARAVQTELRNRGRFLAQVIVPAQRMVDGIVELQVIEGKLGQVRVDVKPAAHLSSALVDSTVKPLSGNPPIERDLIDGSLLRLGDLRGVSVHSVLKPGDMPGTADLEINVDPSRRYAGDLEYDNGGSVYTGRDRVSASLDVFDLAGRGDVASLSTQASSGTRYAQGSWLVPINGYGTRVGPVAGWLSYQLGTPEFDPLEAKGTASWLALQLQHPLIRSQDHNLYLQASIGTRRFDDEERALGVDDHKHIDGYASLGLSGQLRDSFRGLNSYSATVSSGRLGIDDPDAAKADQHSYQTAGRYYVYALSFSRLQTLTSRDTLFLGAHAQFASRNLDSSEKLSLGGMSMVRGYPESDSPSDEGAVLTWEYRRLLGTALRGRWTGSVFGDYGFGRLHKTPLATDPTNTRDIHSHGVGLEYGSDMGFSIHGSVAWRGHASALSDDRGARLLIQATYAF